MKNMKKKTTKGARKAKLRDLPAKKRAAGAVKGGAASIINPKGSLSQDSCWVVL